VRVAPHAPARQFPIQPGARVARRDVWCSRPAGAHTSARPARAVPDLAVSFVWPDRGADGPR